MTCAGPLTCAGLIAGTEAAVNVVTLFNINYIYLSSASLFASSDTMRRLHRVIPGHVDMYTIAMFLLIHHLIDNVIQVWYADFACTCSTLSSVCQ